MLLALHQVTFTYPGASEPVLTEITAHLPPGWTGVIGANGMGKTTLLRLACRELEPQEGRVQVQGAVIYCAQRTDDPPSAFDEFLQAVDAEACRLRALLEVGDDWPARWTTLSHGERKRAQLAVALWQRPSVLAVDEPTNHLDTQARAMIATALRAFDGIGLLVSHDRELLDILCDRCLLLTPAGVTLRPGGYSQATAQAQLETETARKAREDTEQVVTRLKKEAQARQQKASANQRISKRHLDRHDSDGRGKIDLARVSGQDGKAARLARRMSNRATQAEAALQAMPWEKSNRLGFWQPGSRSQRDHLFSLPAETVSVGDSQLVLPELTMFPEDRIALTGVNGAGKSTLIRHLLARLTLPAEKVVYLPQEVTAAETAALMREVQALSHAELGLLLSLVGRLGAEPERLLDNLSPSPGETRKLLLALGVLHAPHLIIMDEPTNHLDLPALECLESALAGCPCGLLLVSHDHYFLRRLTHLRWHITVERHPAGRTMRLHTGDWEA